jgi:hypothetical protein
MGFESLQKTPNARPEFQGAFEKGIERIEKYDRAFQDIPRPPFNGPLKLPT